jgi:hypothetical protein
MLVKNGFFCATFSPGHTFGRGDIIRNYAFKVFLQNKNE